MMVVWERLKEPSTWRGIVAFMAMVGISLTPEQSDLIMKVGLGVYGLIQTFRKEKK